MKLLKILLTLSLSLSFIQVTSAQTINYQNCKNYGDDTVAGTSCNAVASENPTNCEAIKTTKQYIDAKNASQNSKDPVNKKNAETVLKSYNEEIENCKTLITQNEQTKIIETKNQLNLSNQFNGECISTDKTLNCNTKTPNDESLKLIKNIIDNNFVYQLIDPISDEDLIVQKRACTFDFQKDRNGLYQSVGQTTSTIRDENFYKNNTFTLTEYACYTAFVTSDNCQPFPVTNRNIKLTDDIPISVDCKTFQIIYGNSGTDFIKRFVSIVYRLAVGIVGVVAVLVMVINGIRISTAGDDSGVVSDAKERIAQSIFGLAILFFAWLILRSVNPNFFVTEDLIITDPAQTTEQNQSTNTTQ